MRAILHNIRSVYNVASIFRTADGLGVEKLYLTGYTPTPTDRFGRKRQKFTKVSLGAEDTVAWEREEDVEELISELKRNSISVITCEPTAAAQDINSFSTDQDVCLVFGNEVDGVSSAIIDQSDAVVKIPMSGKKSSFNVAVAFGIIMHKFDSTK